MLKLHLILQLVYVIIGYNCVLYITQLLNFEIEQRALKFTEELDSQRISIANIWAQQEIKDARKLKSTALTKLETSQQHRRLYLQYRNRRLSVVKKYISFKDFDTLLFFSCILFLKLQFSKRCTRYLLIYSTDLVEIYDSYFS